MKKVLITGSSQGIGLAIAKRFIAEGWYAYTNYAHNDDAAQAAGLEAGRYEMIKADVSTPEGVEALTGRFLGAEGPQLDCLVLNAGGTCRKAFGSVGYADWQRVMDTNVNMPFHMVQRLRDVIAESGSILFIGSDMGIYPHAVSAPYGVAKAAVHMLAKSLVKEFAPRGVRVNALAPGFIGTEWQREKPGWLREKIEQKIALRRFGLAEEVADAAWFMANNAYLNGAVLPIDGGYDVE